jgi:branched-chain amino acid transport system ATP-binding protein
MSEGVPLLEVSGLVVRYGAVTAVRGADLRVNEGEIVSIVGPNGAGKTSLISAVAGIVPPAGGSIVFAGKLLAGIALEDVVARGLALVPEGRHIFASLTVMENLMLGATVRTDPGNVRTDIDRSFAMFPILGERRRQPAGQLSGGEQQQLAIVRALLSRPRLLMLDEPSLGLAPAVVSELFEQFARLRDEGMTLLIVDQMADYALAIADRGYVLGGGRVVAQGSPSELRGAMLDDAYLGSAS